MPDAGSAAASPWWPAEQGLGQAGHGQGLATWRKGPMNGWGSQQVRATSGAAAVSRSHQRQRGDGGAPVGVSSRMSPRQAAVGMPACCS